MLAVLAMHKRCCCKLWRGQAGKMLIQAGKILVQVGEMLEQASEILVQVVMLVQAIKC